MTRPAASRSDLFNGFLTPPETKPHEEQNDKITNKEVKKGNDFQKPETFNKDDYGQVGEYLYDLPQKVKDANKRIDRDTNHGLGDKDTNQGLN